MRYSPSAYVIPHIKIATSQCSRFIDVIHYMVITLYKAIECYDQHYFYSLWYSYLSTVIHALPLYFLLIYQKQVGHLGDIIFSSLMQCPFLQNRLLLHFNSYAKNKNKNMLKYMVFFTMY